MAAGAKVRIINPKNLDPTDMVDADLAKLRDLVDLRAGAGMFWITVGAERISRVEEQYLP